MKNVFRSLILVLVSTVSICANAQSRQGSQTIRVDIPFTINGNRGSITITESQGWQQGGGHQQQTPQSAQCPLWNFSDGTQKPYCGGVAQQPQIFNCRSGGTGTAEQCQQRDANQLQQHVPTNWKNQRPV